MGLLKKNGATEGSDSNGLSMMTEKTWLSSYLYSMGLPEKSAGAAGSGSGKPSRTTERVAFFLYLFYGAT